MPKLLEKLRFSKRFGNLRFQKIPIISGQKVVKALVDLGYAVDHQTGSHIILRHKDPPHRRLTVPNHNEIAKGTLRAIIKQAGLTRDRFLELVK